MDLEQKKIRLLGVEFNDRHTNDLEEWIDEYTKVLPPLESFILPGGSITSANLHVARSVCRRAERRLQPLVSDNEIDIEAMKYINRLSDFLFTLDILMSEGGP